MNRDRALRAVPDSVPASSTPDPVERERELARHLAACARGDHASFEKVYDAMAGAVYGIALRVVRDAAMAEEVAQDALVEVWRCAASYRAATGSARSWILTIAHRRAVDKVRSEQAHAARSRRVGARATVDPTGQDAVVDEHFGAWEAGRVRAGLATLTSRQREALDLAYFHGYTHREVAEELGIPLGTAKARIRDALIRLRDGWEEER